MPGSLPPEDEIARLRVEKGQGAVLTDPGCRPSRIGERAYIKQLVRDVLELSPPDGSTPQGVLAVALWDAENTNRLSEMPQTVIDAMTARAARTLEWARLQGWELRYVGPRERAPALAPGIETGTATTEGRGAQHESPMTEGQAPTPIPDSLHTQTGREGGEEAPGDGTPAEIG